MAAEVLAEAGVPVDLYDAMPSVGRKFLMAGKSGLNITHEEELSLFVSRYASQGNRIADLVRAFPPRAIVEWVRGLGIETLSGSSGRVFPLGMKASPLLRAWLARLREQGVTIHLRHRWEGWDEEGGLLFTVTRRGDELGRRLTVKAPAVVFALGGGSWRRLGSDGEWAGVFRANKIAVSAFEPSNVGFCVPWSAHMRERFAGEAVKAVRLSARGASETFSTRGEFVITETGVEGGGIYSLSTPLRQELAISGEATLRIDLAPDVEEPTLAHRLASRRPKDSMSAYLRKAARLDGLKRALLYEFTDRASFEDPLELARAIKSVPLRITGAAPLDEAISTAGGVRLGELDSDLMLRDRLGTFCAGEMLDWDAPTGGYLLTACLATGRRAGEGVLRHLGKGKVSVTGG